MKPANYWYLMAKPEGASLMDAFPEPPFTPFNNYATCNSYVFPSLYTLCDQRSLFEVTID